MQTLSDILQVTQPWLLKTVESHDLVREKIAQAVASYPGARPISLNAHNMRGASEFYDELARQFALPAYFGRNLNALEECLTDLEWLPATAYIILIRDAQNLLCAESAEKLEGFLDVLSRAGNEWSKPVEKGEAWDRPPKPFHTIFQCDNLNWRPEIPVLSCTE